MSIVATLDLLLRADTSGAERGLDKVSTKVKTFADGTNTGAGRVDAAMGGLSLRSAAVAGAVGGAMAAVGAAVVAAGQKLWEMGKASVDSFAGLESAALRLGTTTGALVGLQHGAALSGISADDLSHKLAKLQKHLSEAAQGGGDVVLALRQLNLRAEQLKDLPIEEQLGRIADKLKEMGNAADKVRLAEKIFGRQAGSGGLVPFLLKGSEGIRAMIADAAALGPVNAQAVAEVKAVQTAYRDFQGALAGIGRSLAVIFAPAMQSINEALASITRNLAGFGSQNITLFREAVNAAVALGASLLELGNPVKYLGELFGKHQEQVDGAGDSWGRFKHRLTVALVESQFIFKNWASYMGMVFEQIGVMAIEFGHSFLAVFTKTIPEAFRALMDLFAGGFTVEAFEEFKAAIAEAVTRPRTDFEETIREGLEKRWKALDDGMTEHARKKFDALAEAAKRGADKPPAPGTPLPRWAANPAAMERGGAAAFTALFGGQEDIAKKAYSVANQHLAETKAGKELLRKILKSMAPGFKKARL